MSHKSSLLKKIVLYYLFFPYSFPKTTIHYLTKSAFYRSCNRLNRFVLLFFFIVLVLPILFLGSLFFWLLPLVEILIFANGLLIEDDFKSVYVSDFSQNAPATISLPIATDYQYGTYSNLVEQYAPVILQKTSHKPAWDLPVALDYDGDDDTRNNIIHLNAYTNITPIIYGEVTAETADAYYLTYSLYKIRDYDHPVRQVLVNGASHDGDNEGFSIRIEKNSMQVTETSGWWHNRFFNCNRTGKGEGSEIVQGGINFEHNTHIIILSQSMGHGARCAQKEDLYHLENTRILRPALNNTQINAVLEARSNHYLTYQIHSFDKWYQYAKQVPQHADDNPFFQSSIPLGTAPSGTKYAIGRFIAGNDWKKNFWVRPKPPWAWDDPIDNIPIAAWHFLPSHAYASYFGIDISHDYLSNRPISAVLNMPANQAIAWLTPGDQEPLKKSGVRHKKIGVNQRYKRAVVMQDIVLFFKYYINRIFNNLG